MRLPGDVVHQRIRQQMRQMADGGKHLVMFLRRKAMDDRVSVFVMFEALRAMRSSEATIYAVATSQEEVGLRGARRLLHHRLLPPRQSP